MSDENGQSTLQDKIKDWVTFVGGIGAISYAAGFIVVTTRLLDYGIIDWNLLNARYLSAGFFFIIFLGVSLVPAISLIMFTSEILGKKFPKIRLEEPHKSDQIASRLFHYYNPAWSKYFDSGKIFVFIRFIILLLMFLLVPAVAISVVNPKIWFGNIGSSDFQAIWNLVLSSLMRYQTLLIPLFLTGLLLYLITHQSKKNWLSDVSIRWLLIGFVVISLLWVVDKYSLEIYPYITEAVGGGGWTAVSLVFDNESAQTAMQLVNLSTNSTTKPLTLLGENDKDYYFLVSNENLPNQMTVGTNASFTNESRAVEIDKDLIKGLIYNVTVR